MAVPDSKLELSLDEIIELEQKKKKEKTRNVNNLAVIMEDDEDKVVCLKNDEEEMAPYLHVEDEDEMIPIVQIVNDFKPSNLMIENQMELDNDEDTPISNPDLSRARKSKFVGENGFTNSYHANKFPRRQYNPRRDRADPHDQFQSRKYRPRHRSGSRKDQKITRRHWTYLQKLRHLRNTQSQMFGVVNPTRTFRNPTHTSGSRIYPLTRNYLNEFDSTFYRRARPISLMSLGSSARSHRSMASNSSRTPHRWSSPGSFKSNTSNHSSVVDPMIAEEIAQLQSAFTDNPNYEVVHETNRKPVIRMKRSSTNVPLTSRFTSYYDTE